SSIQKLILGLYEPDSGQILIDGIDIQQIDPADLRKHMGYVSQMLKTFMADGIKLVILMVFLKIG
ncbi:MAG: ATP-binding cassette domain-containing protein, partial [Bacteroidota bacterium]|nr:ATP-binding cassette domain-containing protein [Bacteroidota bacterium]